MRRAWHLFALLQQERSEGHLQDALPPSNRCTLALLYRFCMCSWTIRGQSSQRPPPSASVTQQRLGYSIAVSALNVREQGLLECLAWFPHLPSLRWFGPPLPQCIFLLGSCIYARNRTRRHIPSLPKPLRDHCAPNPCSASPTSWEALLSPSCSCAG